jgi:hypothetical protein
MDYPERIRIALNSVLREPRWRELASRLLASKTCSELMSASGVKFPIAEPSTSWGLLARSTRRAATPTELSMKARRRNSFFSKALGQ